MLIDMLLLLYVVHFHLNVVFFLLSFFPEICFMQQTLLLPEIGGRRGLAWKRKFYLMLMHKQRLLESH